MKKLFHLILFVLFSSALQAQHILPSAVNLLPNNHGVLGMSVPDANTIWTACGNTNPTSPVALTDTVFIVITDDGGLTWQVKKISNFPGYNPLDIFALNKDTAFLALNTFGAGYNRIVKTTDGGNTWSTAIIAPAAGVWVKFFNDVDGVIINRGGVATTNDGGISWLVTPQANIPAFQSDEYTILSSGNNSCIVKGNSIWFGTSKGRIFRSTNKGLNWTVTNSGLGSNAIIKSLAFKDSLTGIAADCCSGTYAQLALTTDGGQSWNTKNILTPIPIDNIEFVEGTDSTLIGTCDWYKPYNNRRAAYSKDFGKTWTIFNSFIPFTGMEFISPTVGFMGSVEYLTPVAHDALIYKWNSNVLVGIDELYPKPDLTVYPNPFIDFVNLDLNNNNTLKINKIEVLSSNGKLIKKIIPLSINNYQWNLSDLNAGIYKIVIHTNNGKVVRSIIKPQ